MPPPSTWLTTSRAGRSGSSRATPAVADREVGLLERAPQHVTAAARRRGGARARRRLAAAGRGKRRSTSATTASWSRAPAAATTMVAGRYQRSKNAAHVVGRDGEHGVALARRLQPERVVREQAPLHEGVGLVVVGVLVEVAALRGSPGARSRRPRRAAPARVSTSPSDLEAEPERRRPAGACSRPCTPSW